ncbi:hypothetical protein J5226_17270 [Lysobacter sp. K5869]|uniref:hypothetical protein n=1 Tax=Lysobacter sp. K5869 TaxID=2820808 RepID=UPI001C0633DF|nr:hypothetical protein [Lysobacter sp. K5869]QWP75360.1 hypothetical protein J5226_17270 [Lysobacter sp. K5869]
MFAALLLFVASELLLIRARRGLASSAKTALRTSRIAGVLIMIGLLCGVVLFFIGGWTFTPWLIASLVLIAALVVVDHQLLRPWQVRADLILLGSASSADVIRLARDSRALLGRLSSIALFALVAAVMILKPKFVV